MPEDNAGVSTAGAPAIGEGAAALADADDQARTGGVEMVAGRQGRDGEGSEFDAWQGTLPEFARNLRAWELLYYVRRRKATIW